MICTNKIHRVRAALLLNRPRSYKHTLPECVLVTIVCIHLIAFVGLLSVTNTNESPTTAHNGKLRREDTLVVNEVHESVRRTLLEKISGRAALWSSSTMSRGEGSEGISSRRKLADDENLFDSSCLDPNGPQPYVFMSLGRSGSGSSWQVIGNLTGLETPSKELTGEDIDLSRKFFHRVENDDRGRWMTDYLCEEQQNFPKAGVIGFKWKPLETIHTEEPAQSALKVAAQSSHPVIKVVRSRRNLIDVLISKLKHKRALQQNHKHLSPHCLKGSTNCVQKHRAAGSGLSFPIDGMVSQLRELTKQEDEVDRMLENLKVPTIHVSYEKLYLQKDPEEWMRIFRFLGTGPKTGLEWIDVEAAMQHESTSNAFHNETLTNYEEVKRELQQSEFVGLLH